MKYLLLTSLLFSLSGFGEPDLYEGKLLKRDGLLYKPGSLEPFTGKNVSSECPACVDLRICVDDI